MHDFKDYERGPSFDRARSQIATPFQYLDIDLDTATSNQIVNVSGDFLYVDAASTGAVTLELNNQYNDPSAPFYAQPGFGLAALFKQLKLSWSAQPGKFIRLMYSTGDRVVPTNSTTINGTVSTVDGGLSRTLAEVAFVGLASSGAVAAQYSHGELWNPAASGRNLFLETVTVTSSAAQAFSMGHHNASLAGAATLMNKYLGKPAGVALVRQTNNAAQQITVVGSVARIAAGGSFIMAFKEPVLIPPGMGYVVVSNTVNLDMVANFEWYEQGL
jgi:hypothetical protein